MIAEVLGLSAVAIAAALVGAVYQSREVSVDPINEHTLAQRITELDDDGASRGVGFVEMQRTLNATLRALADYSDEQIIDLVNRNADGGTA